MRRNDLFLLTTIDGSNYLLPSGQAVTDQIHPLRLNESGTYCWELLSEELNYEELTDKLIEHLQIEETRRDVFSRKVWGFLCVLRRGGMVLEEHEASDQAICLSIGGLSVRLHAPLEYVTKELADFACEETDAPALEAVVVRGRSPVAENGTCIVRHDELIVLENEQNLILFYPTFTAIREVHVRKSDYKTTLYVTDTRDVTQICHELYLGLRTPFLLYAEEKGYYMLHSVSVEYSGQALLFCAKSGGGKTTISQIFSEAYQAPVQNGDLNLLFVNDEKPRICGTPWCGTSGIYQLGSLPLGRIIFLQKATQPAITHMSEQEATLALLCATIMPNFTHKQLQRNVDTAKKIAKEIPCFLLDATKDRETADLLAQQLGV